MVRRTLTAVVLLVVLVPAVYIGGIPYFLILAAFACTAAWEYMRMFVLRGFEPSPAITIGATLAVLAGRAFWPELAATILTAAVLLSMVWHLYRYERGRDQAAVDMLVTLGGIVYLGWVTAYLIDLRLLPGGFGWLVLVLSSVWIADSVAYFVGMRFGRHKMSVRLSPKKSWEGYLAGVLGGTAFAGILAWLLADIGFLGLSVLQGICLGMMLSSLTTLGDLGESLFKRFAGVKDSGTFLPGHGGAFDRIDSLIWAGVLGYFWIHYLLS